MFIEHPHLRPYYFFENQPVPADHAEYGRIATIAELYCMYLQEIAAQSRNVSAANRSSWFSLLQSVYKSSPAIRTQLENHIAWYSEELRGAIHLVYLRSVAISAEEAEARQAESMTTGT